MRIGIAFDLSPGGEPGEGPDDRYEEYDKPETVAAIADVLRSDGHEVALLGDGRELLEKVLADPPEFVFNLAEGEGVGRCREARVPAALEMLGIAYSGSDPLTLAAALDKPFARRVVQAEGVTVPLGAVVEPDADAGTLSARLNGLAGAFPLIMKPAFEGSSKGIRAHCLVESERDARAVFAGLARDYEQPILVEQFIDGDEVTVGVIGNEAEAEVLGIMRVVPKRPTRRFVYSLDVKRDWARQVDYESPARLAAGVGDHVVRQAHAAYRALGCRDVARIDFRIRDGQPYFIEANPLPGLAPGVSDLVLLVQGYGIDHEELIRRIVRAALARVGRAAAAAVLT